jgi:hypothetical protein
VKSQGKGWAPLTSSSAYAVAGAEDADGLADALAFAFFESDAEALGVGVGVALGLDDVVGAWMHHVVFVTLEVMPLRAVSASPRDG